MFELVTLMKEMAFKSTVRMPYDKAKERADTVKSAIVSLGFAPEEVEYGGSLRRKASTVGDVDIVVFNLKVDTQTFKDVMDILQKQGRKIETQYTDPHGKLRDMPLGDTQTSFLMDGDNVDIKRHDPKLKGAMMVHLTGSADFNIGMRAWLKSFGWGFSQAGLRNEKGEIIASGDEREIFHALGMEYINPEDRKVFPTPKKLPPGAKPQKFSQAAENPRQEKYPKGEEVSADEGMPSEVWGHIPPNVKSKLKDFKLPAKDDEGRPIPRDFLWNKAARHQYFRMRGKFRIPDELKLDRYVLSVPPEKKESVFSGMYGTMRVMMGEAWRDHADPSGFMRAAHDEKNALLIWWYDPANGRFVKTNDNKAQHKDDLEKGNIKFDEVKRCIRGRVFEYQDKVYQIIYFVNDRKPTGATLADIFDKCQSSIDKTITRVIDDNGGDISGMFESGAYVIERALTGGWHV